MSKSNVNPNHYKVAGRERQGEDIAQARNKQQYAENLVHQRTAIGARSRNPAPQDGNASPDGGPTRFATAARKTRATVPKAALRAALRPRGAAPQLPPKQATKKPGVTLQGSDERSTRPAAQKRATSRDDVGARPVTGAVVGVLGRGRPRRRPQPRT